MADRPSRDAPIVCNLEAEDVPKRLGEWQSVLEHVLEHRDTDNGVELTFALDPDLLAALTAVATKEVACCSFFTFTLTIDANAARVAVVAPDDGVSLVRELFGRARWRQHR